MDKLGKLLDKFFVTDSAYPLAIMIKSKQLFTHLLSTVTVTGSLFLATVNPTQASPCLFGKKGIFTNGSGEPSSLVGDTTNLYKKLGVAGVGIATVAVIA